MNNPVDISPNHLDIILDILHKHLPADVGVWVFGSRADWTTKDSSDLDLALGGDSALDRGTIAALEAAFEESSLPYRVDIIDLNQVSDKFKRIVDAQKTQFPMRRYPNDIIGNRNQVTRSDNTLVTGAESDLNLASAEKTNIRSEWRSVNLGDCVIINDESYSPKEAWPFINYLDTKNIHENHINKIRKIEVGNDILPSRARRKVELGDIVYSMVRPNQKRFGIIKKIPKNFLASTEFAVLRGINNIADTDFLYWFLTQDHITEHLQSIAEDNTTTHQAIRPRDLEAIRLLLPSLSEQRAIASILRTLDDKIDLNRRMSQTLEETARALFKSWFVDFDPVRAKMDGRWKRGESLPGLPAHLFKLFPDRLADSELGPIPEGWGVKRLGAIIELVHGKALRAADGNHGKIPVYGSNGQVGWHDKKLVNGPGIVVGRKRNPGIVHWVHGDFFPVDTTFYILPKIDYVQLPFLYFALSGQDLQSASADSAVPGLNRNLAYMNLQVVPARPVLKVFDIHVARNFVRRHQLEKESRILAAQLDALLPRLMSGELRFP